MNAKDNSRTILVGVDFSEASRVALQQAARITVCNASELHVLHVIEALVVSDLAEALRVSVKQEKATAVTLTSHELKRWLEVAELPQDFHSKVTIGVPPVEILEQANAIGADLIVLGAQGANTHRPEVGTLALRVLRKSPVNVLLTDGSHTSAFQKIVACVDFSPNSIQVVKQARQLATQDGSHVDFLHVYHGPWHRLHYRMPSLESAPDFHEQYQELLQRRLNDFVGEVDDLDAARILHESPSSHGLAIADYARQAGADLVVLGVLGRTNMSHALVGSTAERLLKGPPCSVLAVKPAPH